MLNLLVRMFITRKVTGMVYYGTSLKFLALATELMDREEALR